MNHSLMELVRDLITLIDDGELGVGFARPLERGSARGQVSVVQDAQDPQVLILLVRLDIMLVPSSDVERFYRTLLKLNHRFHGRASFNVDDKGMVYLSAGRPAEDLDPGEVVDLILWTSEQADHYDDLLEIEFPH